MRLPLPRIPLPYPLWRRLVLRRGEPPISVSRSCHPLRGLAADFAGLRAVFLADLHLGPHVPERYLRAVLEQAASLSPDFYLLGGDYIDRSRKQMRCAASLLRVITGRGVPVYGVLGNHDWWAERGSRPAERGDFIKGELTQSGVTLIDNAHAVFRRPDDRAGLCIIGLGDCNEDSVEPDRAAAGAPAGLARILLAHNPDVVLHPSFRKAASGVSLMLCGHTHGGQCVLPVLGAPILLVKSRRHGRGVSCGPGFPILTTNGVGVSSLPVRLGCPPEMHELTFVSGDGAG